MKEAAAGGGAAASTTADSDIVALARGGRTNMFGFLLRLAARLPFLFVAGRLYGAETLGRFAYAVIVVEFAAQLATLGLKRGLAEQLSAADRPHVRVVWDAMFVGGVASALAAAALMLFPQAMFPNSDMFGVDWLLPLVIFAIVWSDLSLAALAYRRDVAATVRARAVVEPWTISIAAAALYPLHPRDGLIIAYVLSLVAALAASLWPFLRSYGPPRGWRPQPRRLAREAWHFMPLAAADAVEWGSRRLDIAILGLFYSPAFVGVYYVAQQVATLPQKLKTSFDPILGPVITQKLAAGDRAAVAAQVRQVGFWILAAQAGIALALAIPGEAVMGLIGPNFVQGTGVLAFLLAAEVAAAVAVVSEAALIYVARKRNLLISLGMIAVQAALSIFFIRGLRDLLPRFALPEAWAAAGPAAALLVALGLASVAKSRLLARLLGSPVSGWRWSLVWAAAAAVIVGQLAILLPEWLELALGLPAILLAFGAVIWIKGFTEEDRVLFRRRARVETAK
ncbi:MAG: Membrane protein [uncultured Sphingomonadaceae bacterium]|uniref:Membrane protein n=1 Tax=uncultured Sphingomonadaceae bacterium TaxID=169976 RepID=A0A6J4SCH4_9SPHN|nr:MAG: Membrane protein [uncultured Sphingomonadaceae bacterium]